VVPIKVDILKKTFYMLFHGIFTAVSENTNLNPTKIIQGTFLDLFLLKKSFFERHLSRPMTFLLLFLTV
jgi:hypothetical protein